MPRAEWQIPRADHRTGERAAGPCRVMKTSANEASSDPAVHSQHLQEQMSYLIEHLRSDIQRVHEPQFQALLETAAEVVSGLRTSFEHYNEHREPAWQASASR